MELFSLPEEIFEMIIAAGKFSHDELRSIRLVSKRFATSYAILSELFHGLRLIASRSNGSFLSFHDFSKSPIGPFVRHVTFVPPTEIPYNFDQYKQVFRSQARKKYACYKNAKPPRRSGRTAESRKTLNGPYLHSEEKLKIDFELYELHANVNLFMLDTNRITDNWIKVLQQCSRCTGFRFALVDYNLIGMNGLSMIPECYREPMADRKRPNLHCDIEVAAFFTIEFGKRVIRCMSQAGCLVKELKLQQASMHSERDFWYGLGLHELDLSQLKGLTYEPYLPLYDDEGRRPYSALTRALGDVNCFFERSSRTLEKFVYYRTDSVMWKGEPIALPRMRYLCLGTCEVSSNFMCKWLRSLTSLEVLMLDDITLHHEHTHEYEPSGNWKKIFDVIRDHPTIAKGKLALIHGDVEDPIHHKFGFRKYPNEMSKETLHDFRETVALELARTFPGKVEPWITSYLQGDIYWCGGLPIYFET